MGSKRSTSIISKGSCHGDAVKATKLGGEYVFGNDIMSVKIHL